jgi:hypothetical protein
MTKEELNDYLRPEKRNKKSICADPETSIKNLKLPSALSADGRAV